MDPIKIKGLSEFSRSLRKASADAPKELRVVLNDAAGVVVRYAGPRVPTKTGRAAGSVRARSTRTASRVSGGGRRVPYYAWLDFGGRVGRNRSVSRQWRRQGRYIFEGYHVNKPKFVTMLEDGLRRLAASAGWDVS